MVFGTTVLPLKDHVRMTMWLTNGTDRPLSDLRVQNCVMLKPAKGFEQQHNDKAIRLEHFPRASVFETRVVGGL